MTTENPQNEIDLIDLMKSMGRTLKRMFFRTLLFLLQIFTFLFRYKFVLLAIVIVATAAAFLLSSIKGKSYTGEITLRSSSLGTGFTVPYINKLNGQIEADNKNAVARLLAIDSTDVEQISSIEAFWIVSQNNSSNVFIDYNNLSATDTTYKRNEQEFAIVVCAKSEKVYDIIGNKLIDYINNNEYFQLNYNVSRNERKEVIGKIEEEINELDSLQILLAEKTLKQNSDGEITIYNSEDNKLYHNDIIRLFSEKESLKSTLERDKQTITIISGFIPQSIKRNELKENIIKYNTYLLLIGVFILVVIHLRKNNFRSYLSEQAGTKN